MRSSERAFEVLSVVVVGVLVVLAGCSGFLGGGDGTPGTAESSTDVPEATLPSGVNQTRLVDANALVGAHADALAEEGFVYTYEQRRVKRFPNGTTTTDIDVTGEVAGTAGLTALREEVDRDRPRDETTTVWTNDTVEYRRVVADGTTYERRAGGPGRADAVHYLLTDVLSDGEWNLSSVTDDGSRVVLVADGARDGTPGSRLEPSIDGRLVVDSEGRIRELNVTIWRQWYDSGAGGRINSNQTFTYEVTSVGDAPVARPDWVTEARNATGQSTGTPTSTSTE